MQWTDLVIIILQGGAGLFLFLAWLWLKKLPASLHKRHLQELQHELNYKLEKLKSELSHELELMKISQSELQVRKTEEFISFSNIQRNVLINIDKVNSGDKRALKKIQKEILDISTGLFFFASDETVKQYAKWKIGTQNGDLEGVEAVRCFGKLMVELRKDLGYKVTSLTEDDYLNLFVTDWEKHK